jgi:hypothetical protein
MAETLGIGRGPVLGRRLLAVVLASIAAAALGFWLTTR